jgi:metal-sulfur cluster biosynthetic enzyme
MSPIVVENVSEALYDVIDPDLGVNVVDMGFVYDVRVDEAGAAALQMTLTSPACPLYGVIEAQVRRVLADVVSDVRIEWVWKPVWGPERITPDGREQLQAIGFSF